jgi:hypothetical protein
MFIVHDNCQSLIFSILQQLCCHTVASRSPFLPAVAHIILEAYHQLDAMLRWQSYLVGDWAADKSVSKELRGYWGAKGGKFPMHIVRTR